MGDEHNHERRFHGGPDRLRAPERIALMEVPRVAALSSEGLTIQTALDVGTGTGVFTLPVALTDTQGFYAPAESVSLI